MKFIKENMFYVVMVAVVVVAGIVSLIVSSPLSDSREEQEKARVAMAERIAVFNKRGPKSSQKTVGSLKGQLDRIKQSAIEVTAMAIDANRANYKVPNYPVKNGKALPVFPFNAEVYAPFGSYEVIQDYLNRMAALQNQLDPTTVATNDEYAAEKRRQAQLIVTAITASMPASMAPPTVSDTPILDRAAAEALKRVRLDRARKGKIYIADNALDLYFPANQIPPNASAKQLWEMVLNEWIQSDILGAIKQTNSQAKGVDSAPVKRLVQIKVYREYVTSLVGASATAAPGAAGASPLAPAPKPLTPPPAPVGPTPVGPAGGGPDTGSTDAGPTDTDYVPLVGASQGAALGSQICTKDHDVLRYTFVVIMPARYVTLLQKNLMARNPFHCILNVEMMASEEDPNSRYYFGADPVVRVTMDGQLMLLTQWERGLVDDVDSKKVKFPPLMPVESLKTLPRTALRQEDADRIDQSRQVTGN